MGTTAGTWEPLTITLIAQLHPTDRTTTGTSVALSTAQDTTTRLPTEVQIPTRIPIQLTPVKILAELSGLIRRTQGTTAISATTLMPPALTLTPLATPALSTQATKLTTTTTTSDREQTALRCSKDERTKKTPTKARSGSTEALELMTSVRHRASASPALTATTILTTGMERAPTPRTKAAG